MHPLPYQSSLISTPQSSLTHHTLHTHTLGVKTQMEASVRMYGGTYSSSLDKNASVVISDDLSSEKCRYAALWSIPVVSCDWLWETIRYGSQCMGVWFVFFSE